jgi:hypothetical protein
VARKNEFLGIISNEFARAPEGEESFSTIQPLHIVEEAPNCFGSGNLNKSRGKSGDWVSS